MMDRMVATSIALFAISLTGAFIQTNIGFGFPIIAMIFISSLFPFSTAVAICQVIVMASTIYLTFIYRRHIDWRMMRPILVVSLLTGIVVTTISRQLPQRTLELILGCALLIISLWSVAFSDRIRIKATIGSGAAMGVVAGIGNGLFGMGGPPVAVYMLSASEEKETYMGSLQCYFLISNVSTISVRTFHGDLGWSHFPAILTGWAGIFVGTWLGMKLFKMLPQHLLRKLVYGFVGVAGLSIILRNIR